MIINIIATKTTSFLMKQDTSCCWLDYRQTNFFCSPFVDRAKTTIQGLICNQILPICPRKQSIRRLYSNGLFFTVCWTQAELIEKPLTPLWKPDLNSQCIQVFNSYNKPSMKFHLKSYANEAHFPVINSWKIFHNFPDQAKSSREQFDQFFNPTRKFIQKLN